MNKPAGAVLRLTRRRKIAIDIKVCTQQPQGRALLSVHAEDYRKMMKKGEDSDLWDKLSKLQLLGTVWDASWKVPGYARAAYKAGSLKAPIEAAVKNDDETWTTDRYGTMMKLMNEEIQDLKTKTDHNTKVLEKIWERLAAAPGSTPQLKPKLSPPLRDKNGAKTKEAPKNGSNGKGHPVHEEETGDGNGVGNGGGNGGTNSDFLGDGNGVGNGDGNGGFLGAVARLVKKLFWGGRRVNS